jgi:hypothetical protein
MTNVFISKMAVAIFMIAPLSVTGQKSPNSLSDKQYEIINSFYSKSADPNILYHETIDYKSWINLIKPSLEDNYSTCPFQDLSFSETVKALQLKVSVISLKKIDQERLLTKVKLSDKSFQNTETGDSIPTTSISEPLIVGKYAFMFQKKEHEELLLIFTKNDEDVWEWRCFITCYLVIND